MKIAVIAHLHYPIAEPFSGGLEMHTHLLVRHLMQRGHEVDLYALGDSDPAFTLKPLQLDAISTTTQLEQHEENESFEFMDKYHTYMDVMLRIIAGGYDVVHNNSLHYLPPAMAHLLPCPMVTALHTPPFPSLQSGVMTSANFGGSQFTAVSETLCRQWASYAPECQVVRNGVELQKWPMSERSTQKSAFWAGRICPEKAPHLAIAAALQAGYTLAMVGKIHDNAYYEAKVRPLFSDRVRYLGLVSQQEMAYHAGSAEVALFSSVWEEPFGLVLAEYLACGTPVVAFEVGAAAEVLDESCGILVPKVDVAAMARAIPVAATLSRQACRRRVASFFKVEKMIDDYEALYRRMIKTSRVVTRAVGPDIFAGATHLN